MAHHTNDCIIIIIIIINKADNVHCLFDLVYDTSVAMSVAYNIVHSPAIHARAGKWLRKNLGFFKKSLKTSKVQNFGFLKIFF